MTAHNPFNDQSIAEDYDAWYYTAGENAVLKEKRLLRKLLANFCSVNTILNVGCGTGHFTNWFLKQGLNARGLDRSRPMLHKAKEIYQLKCIQGDASALPFSAKSYDLVSFLTTLEFLPEPELALEEAVRVARRGLILGVINKHSFLGWQYKRKGGPIWDAARFFTPHELIQMLQPMLSGSAQVIYRTTLSPLCSGSSSLPFGGFIGLIVKLEKGEM